MNRRDLHVDKPLDVYNFARLSLDVPAPFHCHPTQLPVSRLEANSTKSAWPAMLTTMANIPDFLTTIFMAQQPESEHAFMSLKVLVGFTMLPIVAGSATALLIQLPGPTSFPSHPLPEPAPAPPDPHR